MVPRSTPLGLPATSAWIDTVPMLAHARPTHRPRMLNSWAGPEIVGVKGMAARKSPNPSTGPTGTESAPVTVWGPTMFENSVTRAAWAGGWTTASVVADSTNPKNVANVALRRTARGRHAPENPARMLVILTPRAGKCQG